MHALPTSPTRHMVNARGLRLAGRSHVGLTILTTAFVICYNVKATFTVDPVATKQRTGLEWQLEPPLRRRKVEHIAKRM